MGIPTNRIPDMAYSDDFENLDVTADDGVVQVVLDSTGKYNSLNSDMAVELLSVATDVSADESARCVVITGSGDVFCGGADLSTFDGDETDAPMIRREASQFHDAIVELHGAGVPILSGVNGPAIGAGFSIAILADIVLMSEAAHFEYGYTRIGLPGDGGISYFLPRIVGSRRAKEIALFDETLGPEEALDLGLVTETVDPAAFDERLAELADRLASGPTTAFGTITELMTRSFDRDLERQLSAETDGIANAIHTEDYQRGLRAFGEEKSPEFTGS